MSPLLKRTGVGVVATALTLFPGCSHTVAPPSTASSPGKLAAPAVPPGADVSRTPDATEGSPRPLASTAGGTNPTLPAPSAPAQGPSAEEAVQTASPTAATGVLPQATDLATSRRPDIPAGAHQGSRQDSVPAAPRTDDATPSSDGPHERILLLATGGLLVIDAQVRLGGESIEMALERLVDEVLQVADANGDGQARWGEVVDNPRFQSGEFGNLVAGTDEERQQLIRIYDADQDGEVDRVELPRFVTRNSGGGRSFSLRSSNEFRSSNRRSSPTRLLIDHDRDGAMTVQEMNEGPARMRLRDSNDDDTIELAELKDRTPDLVPAAPAMSRRRRVTEPDTAIWLTDPTRDLSKRWGMVQFQLQELYSYGDPIGAGDWPMTPELFQSLDADADEELSQAELSRLMDVPPHFVVDVVFDRTDPLPQGSRDVGPRIKLRRVNPELAALRPAIVELPTRITIQLPSLEVVLFVNEDPTLTDLAGSISRQFATLDRNHDGYLESGELPSSAPGLDAPFASLDADQDGKVFERELLAYAERRNAVTRAQVRARAADQEDALFTALDTDGDGRLNARELRQTPDRLRAMDRNGDGCVHADEIPGSMIVAFVRGNAQQDEQLFSGPASQPLQPSSSPRWFAGMDANGDGEISAREFFGAAELFRQADTDRNGFLSPEEAQALVASHPPQP